MENNEWERKWRRSERCDFGVRPKTLPCNPQMTMEKVSGLFGNASEHRQRKSDLSSRKPGLEPLGRHVFELNFSMFQLCNTPECFTIPNYPTAIRLFVVFKYFGRN
jgi:hypothetical protein